MPVVTESSGALASKAAAGDKKAFDALYESTFDSAYYTASLILTSREDIADALQNSYMKAFAHIGELERPESFEKWLKKIVVNECRNYLRDNGKHLFSTVYIGGSYDDIEDCGADLADEIANGEELRRTLEEILASLPEKQRICVELFYYEKYSVAEISSLLGVSDGTVKSRLHYGRKALERKYKRSSAGEKYYGVAVIPGIAALLAYKSARCTAPAAVKSAAGSAIAAQAQAAGLSAAALPAAVTAGAAGTAVSAGAGVGAAAIVGKVAAVAAAAAVTAGGAAGIKTYVESRPEPTSAQSTYSEEHATVAETATQAGGETAVSITIAISDTSVVTAFVPSTKAAVPTQTAAAVPPQSLTAAASRTAARTERTSKPTTTRKAKTTALNTTTTKKAASTTAERRTEPAATAAPEDNYVLSGGVLTGYKGSGGNVNIPSQIGSSAVTAIGAGAFTGNTSVRSVSLPNGVKKIGQEAFADCTSLSSVSLPSTLESIAAGAFYGCTALGSVNIPSGTSSIGDDAFYGCSSLKTVTIPDSVTSIGDGAFDGCDGVTIKCSAGSAAYEYAVANGISVST